MEHIGIKTLKKSSSILKHKIQIDSSKNVRQKYFNKLRNIDLENDTYSLFYFSPYDMPTALIFLYINEKNVKLIKYLKEGCNKYELFNIDFLLEGINKNIAKEMVFISFKKEKEFIKEFSMNTIYIDSVFTDTSIENYKDEETDGGINSYRYFDLLTF